MARIINYLDYTLEVEYDYEPEEPMVMYYKDGSGHPGSPAIVNIYSCKLGDVDILDLLAPNRIEDIEELIFNQIKEEEEYGD